MLAVRTVLTVAPDATLPMKPSFESKEFGLKHVLETEYDPWRDALVMCINRG